MTDSLNGSLHRQLPRLVADKVRTAILDGVFKPGEWLRQERLAQQYGVSQMPVREALKELASEGLVEHVPYRGVRVISYSPHDVEDLYAHRAFLEGRAAYFAAGRVTPDELQALRATRDAMARTMAPEQIVAYRELNRRFHQMVAEAGGRPYLTRTLVHLWETLPTMLLGNFARTARAPLGDRDDADVREHDAIIAALAAGDAAAAQVAMVQHIASAGRELIAAIGVAAGPNWIPDGDGSRATDGVVDTPEQGSADAPNDAADPSTRTLA
ncbi:MAG: GntR family transcriptional regulator [Caldilineaceae bacterium]